MTLTLGQCTLLLVPTFLCPLAFPNHLLTSFHDPLLGLYDYAFGRSFGAFGRSFGHAFELDVFGTFGSFGHAFGRSFEVLRVFHLVHCVSSLCCSSLLKF